MVRLLKEASYLQAPPTRKGDAEAQHRYLARYQELNPDDPAALFNQAVEFLNNMDDEKARLAKTKEAVEKTVAECKV